MDDELCVPTHLPDDALLSEAKRLATRECTATARLIACLAEVDSRRLYHAAGYSSLFTFCTSCLHLSEHAAYGRIEAARVVRRLPRVLGLLADGSMNLTNLCLLASHLTAENHERLLLAARHKTKREVEQQVAALRPLPDAPTVIRKLPTPVVSSGASTPNVDRAEGQRLFMATAADTATAVPSASSRRTGRVMPLTPDRYKVQFTVSRATHDTLRRVQDLMRHSVPTGDLAAIFDRALVLLLATLEKRKLAQTDRPRRPRVAVAGSRHVAAHVRREVWTRDGGQCAFVGEDGRCAERGFLEFHHVVPFAAGGATSTSNVQLRCRAHNRHEADLAFPLVMDSATTG